MSKKVGLVTYPTAISKIAKDIDLLRAFNSYVQTTAYKAFLVYITAHAKPHVRYDMFFRTGAPHKIDISPKMQQIADAAAGSENWKSPEYKNVIDYMKQYCVKVIDSKAVPGFFDSKAFVDYHCQRVTGRTNPGQAATDAAKKLNLSDRKHVDVVKQIFLEALFGKESKIDRLNKELEATKAKGSKGSGKRDVFGELKAARMLNL